MTDFKDVISYQPYPCFKLTRVPEVLRHKLKKGMLCLYNIDQRIFEFPTVGQFGLMERFFSYLDFVGYYSIQDFRDSVFAGQLPVSCPSCKGPVEDAGMISFELEEPGTAQIDFISGDAEMFFCEFCKRPFALMPVI
ncbi:MAG TPA: hypothetical protein VGJ93_02330 [Desulfuromonadaceae bacterium]|jgi:hypothetical protein